MRRECPVENEGLPSRQGELVLEKRDQEEKNSPSPWYSQPSPGPVPSAPLIASWHEPLQFFYFFLFLVYCAEVRSTYVTHDKP